jgi:methylmalonyl-CoA/ethylmalonyl-CoA epimerase
MPPGLAPDTVQRIDHVGIVVRNADAAIAAIGGVLGLRLIHDEFPPDLGVRLAYLGPRATAGAASILQLVQPTGPGPIKDFLDSRGEGLHHVCFAVDDVASCIAELQHPPQSVFLGGQGRRCAFLEQQPHGLRIELIETSQAT